MEGGGTQQHIVVSKARRGEEREESDVGVLVLCGGLPLPPERDRIGRGRRVSERESWEKWAPPRQLHRAAGENVQQCNVVLLVRCMTDDEDGDVWREGRPVV